MPRTEDREKVQGRVFDLLKGLRGEHQLKELCRELNYEHRNTSLSSRNWRSAAAQKLVEEKRLAAPVLLASAGNGGDFQIIYTRLQSPDLRLAYERQVVSQLLQDHPYALFVFSNAEQNHWHFVNVKYHEQASHRRIFRRIAVGGHDRLHTAAKRMAMLDIDAISPSGSAGLAPLDIQKIHDEAFDVEAVTEKFYHGDERTGEKGYKHVFDALQNDLLKQTRRADRRWAHDYALQFLNRSMFLYFVQRKNWLGEDAGFLRSFWQSYRKAGRPKDSFFADWLSVLFFEAFNQPFHARKTDRNFFLPQIRETIKRAPFLNGGLFRRNELDTPPRLEFTITDSIFESVFSFLERHEFTITQESPIDQAVAVDSQMIGSVYETLVNVSVELEKQGDAGVFFTPRLEIDLMCRLALVDCLANHLGQEHKPLLYETIFALEEDEKVLADRKLAAAKLWPEFATRLRELTVLDPACGSGSFLVGMLYVLNDLHERASQQLGKREDGFARKRRIIAENLYGVDVMKWATQVAEWRLWLNLMVDAPAHLKASEKALLPHFACKIRCGDSLVQEIGGINLGHRRWQHEIPSELQKQVSHLKQQKLDYYYNCSNLSFAEISKLEGRLYLQFLQKRQEAVAKEIKRLQSRLVGTGPTGRQLRLDGTAESSSHQMELQAVAWQKLLEILQAELANIDRTHEAVKRGDEEVFVWDIAFPEIFAGEKRGFDLVVGNPPYVRQEKIANPRLEHWEVNTENRKDYKTKLARSVYQLYPDYFGYKPAQETAARELAGRSDLYIYFYFHALSLLNLKGSFCFITSNSWLDVGYGAELQEFLLKHCHVKMILDNQVRRSFRQADVNTVIVLFSAPDESSEWEDAKSDISSLEKTARFVMLKAPFESLFSNGLLQEIEATRNGERRTTTTYRIHPAQQQTLLVAGSEDVQGSTGPLIKVERYLGDKWGGKYLRAPDIYWTILKKGKGKLVRLGDIAEVRFGIKTGANEFFYLDEARIREWGIEREFLKPILFSLKEIRCIENNLSSLRFKFLSCHESLKELRGKKVAEYIKWGESKGFHRKPTCASRPLWYSIGKGWKPAMFVFPAKVGERMVVMRNTQRILEDKKLYGITPNTGDDTYWGSVLNSTIVRFFMDLLCRQLTGAQAIADIDVRVVEEILVPRIEAIAIQELNEKYTMIAKRPIASHVQEEYSQPDRRLLDDVFFDVLCLTQSERDAVYEAVIDLVKSRLKKAESLKSKNRHEDEEDEEMKSTSEHHRQPLQKARITKRVKAA